MSSNSERDPKRIKAGDYDEPNRSITPNPFLDDFLDALFNGTDAGENLLGTGTLPSGISATDPEAIINEILNSIPDSEESLKSSKRKLDPVAILEKISPDSEESLKLSKRKLDPVVIMDKISPDSEKSTRPGQAIMNEIISSIPNSGEATTSSSKRATYLEATKNTSNPSLQKLIIPRKRRYSIKQEITSQSTVSHQTNIPVHQLNSIRYHSICQIIDRVVETIDLTGDDSDNEINEEQTTHATIDLLSENDDDNMDILADQIDSNNKEAEDDVAQADDLTEVAEISLTASSSSSNSYEIIARNVLERIVEAETVMTESMDISDDEKIDILAVDEEETAVNEFVEEESMDEEVEVDELNESSSDEPTGEVVDTLANNNIEDASVENTTNENVSFEYVFSTDDTNIENATAEDASAKDINDENVNVENANIDNDNVENFNVEGDDVADLSVKDPNTDDISIEDAIVEDAIAEDASVEDVSVENAGAENIHSENNNIKETSAQDTNIDDASVEDAYNETSADSPNMDNDSGDEDVFYDVEYDAIDEQGNLLNSQKTGSQPSSHTSLEEGEIVNCRNSRLPPSLPANMEEGEKINSQSSKLPLTSSTMIDEGNILGCQNNGTQPLVSAAIEEVQILNNQNSGLPPSSPTITEVENLLSRGNTGLQPLSRSVIESVLANFWDSDIDLEEDVDDNEDASSSDTTDGRELTIDKNIVPPPLSSTTCQSISKITDKEGNGSDSDVIEDSIDDNEVMEFSEAMDVNENIDIGIKSNDEKASKNVDDRESIEDTEVLHDSQNIDDSEVDELSDSIDVDKIVDENQNVDASKIMSDNRDMDDDQIVEFSKAIEVYEDVETSKVVKSSEYTEIVQNIETVQVIETCEVMETIEAIEVVENAEISKVAEFSVPVEDIENGESRKTAVNDSDHEAEAEDEILEFNAEINPVQESHNEPSASQPEDLPSFHANTQIIPEAWRDEEARLASANRTSSGMPINTVTTLEHVIHSNTLKLWWYDAYEDYKGTVYLFGKTFDHIHNKYVSCCVVVENIQREIYILPRKFKLYEGESTPHSVTIEDVRKELEEKIIAKGISNWTMEVCTRKYAFELADIPRETQYVKLSYPFYDYRFPQGTSGDTFSHMFGNSVDILEHFIIKNDIMGPCWLKFKNVKSTSSKQSWCAVEAVISDPKDFSIMKDEDGKVKMDGPPLNILSLSLETKMNHGTQSNEIIAISGFVCPNVDINNQDSATSLPFERFSVTRRVPGANQPREVCLDAERECEKSNIKISLENTEEALLYCLLSKLQVVDADVIVGHNFLGIDLDIILHRMKNFNIYEWSRIGRRRTKKWPRLQSGAGGSGSSTYQEQLVMCGRLVCDTYVASKDLVRCKSYRLTELALSQLGISREEMTVDKIDEYSQAGTIDIELARHGSFDAYLSFALMVKLQILPLTKQLTNLSGNLWSRSMKGGRSERNEYLLLHTFYNNKYICPDKPHSKKKRNIEVIFADDELLELENPEKKHEGANGQAASYAGGLVLEPKSGFYDRYVLLLDFNSLYPSIMQEYNVCFTTMDREPEESVNYNATDIPETPSPDTPEGILPRLVRMFVKRRQHVKRLMKDSSLSKSTKKQYDIEQMALKLTANSMYGCLGSSISRFYARPLAMYITSKGREILQSTVELAESMGYDVIYGDTDSVMINTNKIEMSHAKRIGEKLKNSVNQRYKQLEIDIDGFFRHTLLLRKKKYAALLVKEKPDGTGLRESVEVKGLDLVRRDWCDLSHKVSEHVLSLILSDKSREDVVNDIHGYLKKTAAQIRSSKFELEDFVIQKQLTKAPEEYNKSKSHPHVNVAKDMRRAGIAVKAGDIIPYVMCELRDSINGNLYAFNEPRMPDDVRDKKSKLDIVWYLSKQILPPVHRLCKPIEGTDLTMLANCLGLDTNELVKQRRLVNEADKDTEANGGYDPDLVLIVDEQQYTEADALTLNCANCNHQNEYKGPISVLYSDGNKVVSGLTCTSCGQVMNEASVQLQVVLAIRDYITKYYDSQYQCNQPWCEYSTRFVSPAEGDLCIIRGCPGRFVREFSERMLYSKLSQLSRLFDVKNVNMKSHDIPIEAEIQNYIQSNDVFTPIKKVVDEYLNLSGYKYLNISNIMEDIDMQ